MYNKEHKLEIKFNKFMKMKIKSEKGEDETDPLDNVEEFSVLGRMDRSKKKIGKVVIKTEQGLDYEVKFHRI